MVTHGGFSNTCKEWKQLVFILCLNVFWGTGIEHQSI